MKKIFCLLLLPFFVAAQRTPVSIARLQFMSGLWVQHHAWGDMEEYWGKPMGDNMVCSYRCVKDGKILFYEFVVIEQTDSVPVMKLRHFKPGNIGWEEKDKPYEYLLTDITASKATFKAADSTLIMSYERLNSNALQVVLTEKNKEGKWSTEYFNYTRAKE